MGRFLDTVGRKPMIIGAAAINIVSLLLFLTVGTYGPWMYVTRAMFTASELALFTAFLTYAADSLPASRRAQGLAYCGQSGLVPIGIGALVADVVLARYDYEGLFIISAGFIAFSLSVAMTLPRRASDERSDLPRRSILAAFTQRDLIPVWIISFVFAIGVNVLFTYMRTLVDVRGVGSVGLFFATYSGCAVIVRVAGSALPERFGVSRVLPPMFLATAGAQLLLAEVMSLPVLLAAAALGGFGHGLVFPILSSEVVRRARISERGSAVALFTSVFDLAVLMAVPVVGRVIDAVSYPAAFRTTSVMMVIGLVLFVALDRIPQSEGTSTAEL